MYVYDRSGLLKHEFVEIDLDPITTEKPTFWHKEMHLLIIFARSVFCLHYKSSPNYVDKVDYMRNTSPWGYVHGI